MSNSMQKCPECQYPRLLLTTAIVRELIRVSELYSASCAMHLFIMLQSLLLFRVNQSNRDVLPIGVPVPAGTFRTENGPGAFRSERCFRTAKLPKKATVPHFLSPERPVRSKSGFFRTGTKNSRS